MRSVSGQVAKGPVDAATVRFFAIDARGRRHGAPLAEAITDAAGRWDATLPAASGALLVVSSGGRYIDEADPEPDPSLRRSVTLGDADGFATLLPAGERTVALNIYTDALLRKSRHETEGENFFEVFAANRAFIERAFGFDLLDTLPADPIGPAADAGALSRRYAMALGGAANVVNEYASANGRAIADFAIIDAVVRDLTDCVVDGHGVAGALDDVSTAALDLNTQILRFRNNNFGAYDETDVLVVDAAQCGRSGRLDDVVAPVFTSVPAGFTVAAVDASGTPASAVAVQAGLATARATDDRDGELIPTHTLPAQLPLGTTTVTLRAVDRSGNAAEATVQIVVADLDPPTIVAPAGIDVAATGPLTAVALGAPVVADNVSAVAELDVSHDAPVSGFAPGTTTVTWTVQDAAGLAAAATQVVTVRSAAPALLAPVPDLSATEGEFFIADLGASFADPDSALIFSLSPLPAGSGLAFDTATGVLAGVPRDTDAKAAPLRLTVTARDETTAVSTAFALAIADVNNAPAFRVSNDSLELEEDFSGSAWVEVIPAPVAVGDPDDVVYSIDATSADFVDLAIDPVSGRVSLSARPDANGTGAFTITADDGASINNLYSVVVAVSVAALNDPPVFALSRASVDLAPASAAAALVDILPGTVPGDEAGQAVAYRVQHGITFARVDIDAVTGRIAISDTADIEASGVIEVSADDGQPVANTHSEFLTLTVRASDTLTLYVGEPADGISAVRPVFPHPDEVAIAYAASGLPDSLAISATTGQLTGIPTEHDGRVAALRVVFTVTGSHGSVAAVPLVLHIVERDSDADGLPDRHEATAGTDPLVPDSDGDGLGDGIEVEIGSNPLAAATAIRWLTPDETGAVVSPGASGTEGDPVVLALSPGLYPQRLALRPPCDHVAIVGGIAAFEFYPATGQRSVLTPGDDDDDDDGDDEDADVGADGGAHDDDDDGDDDATIEIAGCADVRLHHLDFAATTAGTALALEDAQVSGANLSFYRNDARVMTLERADLQLSGTVLSGNRSGPAGNEPVTLADDSVLLYRNGVIRHDYSARVFALDASSEAELYGLLGNGSYTGAGRVTKTGAASGTVRHAPDEVRLRQAGEHRYVAEMRYLGLRLGRGYVMEIVAPDTSVVVDDINRGDYLVTATRALGGDVMLFVDGRPVPFVIE